MKMRKAGVVLILAMVFCTLRARAMESDIGELWPTGNLYTREQIGELFDNMRFRPFDREDLSFTMLVGKDWQGVALKVSPEQLAQEERGLLPLAEVRAPDWDRTKAAISVHSVKTADKTVLEEWTGAYLQGNGITPLSRRKGTFNGRPVEDVLARIPQGEKTFLVRMTFSAHGSHIFVVACSALEDSFRKYARTFSIAAITFQPAQ